MENKKTDRKLQPRVKKVQKISRNGIIETNKATGETTILSKRLQDTTFQINTKPLTTEKQMNEKTQQKNSAKKKAIYQKSIQKKKALQNTQSNEKEPLQENVPDNIDNRNVIAALEKLQKVQELYYQSDIYQQEQNQSQSENESLDDNSVSEASEKELSKQNSVFKRHNQKIVPSTNILNKIPQDASKSVENTICPVEKLSTDQTPELQQISTDTKPFRLNVQPEEQPITTKNTEKQTAVKKKKVGSRLKFTKEKKDTSFTPTQNGTASITENKATEEKTPSKSLKKAEKKLDKTQRHYEKAKTSLPSRHKLKFQKKYDENTNTVHRRFTIEKETSPQGKESLLKSTIRKTGGKLYEEANNVFHQKIRETEKDNVGIEATHKLEQEAEPILQRSISSSYNRLKNKPYQDVAQLERKLAKANRNYQYQLALQDHPELKHKFFARQFQKNKIKRQYAKKARQAKNTTSALKKTISISGKAGQAAGQFVVRHFPFFMVLGVIAILFSLFSSALSSCSSMLTGGVSAIVSTSYTAKDKDINQAEKDYTAMETQLQEKINHIENYYPGYNEYRRSIPEIGHNPYELMAYFTAKYDDFTVDNIKSELEELFHQQYQLDLTETIETRTRSDGSTYEWHILNVNLKVKPLSDIFSQKLSSEEQRNQYNVYLKTKGNRQYFSSPFSFDWIPYIENIDENHIMTLLLPSGKDVIAGKKGTVTQTGNGIVSIEDKNQYTAIYSGLSSISVNSGDIVKAGDILGKSSSKMKLSFSCKGETLNPYFFVASVGSSIPGLSGGVEFPSNPGTPIGDGSYQALIAEGEKYLGFPYVWGGSSPSTSFDCSGFICWIFTHSGVHNLPRTTAQGIFNQCTPISAENAKPGDIIFFTGTYSSPNPVTHVGLYVGNGQMLHCGTPIGYANINTSYWQNHFYSFGRLN